MAARLDALLLDEVARVLVQFGRVAIDAGPSGPKRPGLPRWVTGSRARCFEHVSHFV